MVYNVKVRGCALLRSPSRLPGWASFGHSNTTFGNTHLKQTYTCLSHVGFLGECEQERGVRHIVEGAQSLTAQPENLGIALIGRSKARLAVVTLVEGKDTANCRVAELVCDCGEVDVSHAFVLVFSAWEAYSGVRVIEYGVGRRATIDE